MPYKGGTNGGGEGGGYDPLSGGMTTSDSFFGGGGGGGGTSSPTLEKVKKIKYNATTSDQIFAISSDASATTAESMPGVVEVENNGDVPIMLMVGYSSYSDDTSIVATDYLHILLPPNQRFSPPVRAVISDNADNTIMFGTAVNNLAPDSNEYTDSTADADDTTATDNVIGDVDDTTLYLEPYTSAANCTSNLFRVGDLVRIRDEVMEVTAIGDKSDLANNTLTVKRGMYGSTAVTSAADDDPVRLPFFNAYHDYDKFSVAQTDSNGKFKCFNFFGQGRTVTESQGLIAGSFAIKFYESGYQSLGLSGLTSSTNSGLTASTAYEFDIQVDGGTNFDNLSFTTDSSNVNFGGTNGVISKIQAALDAQYYTAGNLFEKKVRVGLVDGDLRFTSGTYLSTSAIALTAGSTGTAEFFGTGRIPAVGSINAAVAAKLPDDVVYDRVTYAASPNTGVFGYDDGYGNVKGACRGIINYETGALDITGCPPNAEFVVTALTNSAFSGKLNEGETNRINSIVSIFANTSSQKGTGSVVLRTW